MRHIRVNILLQAMRGHKIGVLTPNGGYDYTEADQPTVDYDLSFLIYLNGSKNIFIHLKLYIYYERHNSI